MVLKGKNCNPGPGPVGCRGELGISGYYYSIQEIARLIDCCRAKDSTVHDMRDCLERIRKVVDATISKKPPAQAYFIEAIESFDKDQKKGEFQ